MVADEINDLWDARPFCPFEIAMANGETHTVTSPKLFLMSPFRLSVVTPDGRMRLLVLNQVNRVTSLATEREGASSPTERR